MELPQNSDQQFQYVPVPVEHVVEVLGFIHSLSTRSDSRSVTGGPAWTPDLLAQLANAPTKTATIVNPIWDLMAEHPNRHYSIETLANETNQSAATVRGVWTHLSRHINKHLDARPWPMEWERSGTELTYWFTDAQAEMWRAARKLSE